MAHAFGLDPETVEKWPHRKFVEVIRWLNRQWNEPSRSDWYLMQIAMMLTTGEMKLGEFKLPLFSEEKETKAVPKDEPHVPGLPRRVTAENRAQIAAKIQSGIIRARLTAPTSAKPTKHGTQA